MLVTTLLAFSTSVFAEGVERLSNNHGSQLKIKESQQLELNKIHIVPSVKTNTHKKEDLEISCELSSPWNCPKATTGVDESVSVTITGNVRDEEEDDDEGVPTITAGVRGKEGVPAITEGIRGDNQMIKQLEKHDNKIGVDISGGDTK